MWNAKRQAIQVHLHMFMECDLNRHFNLEWIVDVLGELYIYIVLVLCPHSLSIPRPWPLFPLPSLGFQTATQILRTATSKGIGAWTAGISEGKKAIEMTMVLLKVVGFFPSYKHIYIYKVIRLQATSEPKNLEIRFWADFLRFLRKKNPYTPWN